jgi:multidrug resistance efflux pump
VSDHDRPEPAAFRQLEQLVRNLGTELAAFRRRAQTAESRVRVLEAAVSHGADEASLHRLRVLEQENIAIRERLDYATSRTRQLLARMKFLRQQQARPVSPNGHRDE